MNRKKAFRLFMASVACFMILGCSKKEENKTEIKEENSIQREDDGLVNLKIWVENSKIRSVQECINSFKENYKQDAQFEITIEERSPGDISASLLKDIHNGADVFIFADDGLRPLVAGGGIDLVEDKNNIMNTYTEESVSTVTINDNYYAYPLSADNGYIMYYDKRYFSAKDLETMDGILAVAEKEKKQVMMDLGSGWYLYSFFGNTGMSLGINDDGVTNYCDWNKTEGKITGAEITKSILKITKNPSFICTGNGGLMDGFRNGTIIAGINSVGDAKEIQNILGKNFGAIKLPTYTCAGEQVQMASFIGYRLVGVNYYSKEKEWAHKLAEWITNEESQMTFLNNNDQAPTNQQVGTSEVVKNSLAIIAQNEQSQYAQLQRVGGNYWGASWKYGSILASKNPDNIDYQTLIDELVSGITASIVH